MTETGPPTDEDLLRLLAFAGPADCVDVDDVDHADLLALARGETRAHLAHTHTHLDRCEYCSALLELYREEVARPSRRFAVPGLALAAAVLVAFFMMLDRPETTIPYEVASIRGLVAETMGVESSEVAAAWRVADGSAVRVVLRPRVVTTAPDGATAGVFVETNYGLHRRVEAKVTVERDGPAVAFRIEVAGADLLRGRGAGDRIALVVTESEAALDALGGRRGLAGRPGVLYVAYQRVLDANSR